MGITSPLPLPREFYYLPFDFMAITKEPLELCKYVKFSMKADHHTRTYNFRVSYFRESKYKYGDGTKL